MIAGVVFAETRDGLEQPVETKIAGLIASAESEIDYATTNPDPATAQASAQIALAHIALATFLRGGR